MDTLLPQTGMIFKQGWHYKNELIANYDQEIYFTGYIPGIRTLHHCQAQTSLKQGKWHASLQRQDGHQIPFELDIERRNGKANCYVVNGTERMQTENMVMANDSVVIRMPVFESWFKAKVVSADTLHGVWVQGGAAQNVIIPFVATAGGGRFPAVVNSGSKQVQKVGWL